MAKLRALHRDDRLSLLIEGVICEHVVPMPHLGHYVHERDSETLQFLINLGREYHKLALVNQVHKLLAQVLLGGLACRSLIPWGSRVYFSSVQRNITKYFTANQLT